MNLRYEENKDLLHLFENIAQVRGYHYKLADEGFLELANNPVTIKKRLEAIYADWKQKQ